MAREFLTDEQVEQEIARLKQSPQVRLSKREQQIKADRRRKYLADLRWHEKHGMALEAAGITLENIASYMGAGDES